jgi:hypothetical protein
MPYRITGIDAPVPNPMMVDVQSHFARCVFDLFRQVRPTRIIETGTYFGMGTTAIIGLALRQLQIANAQFFSIEVNPIHHAQAVHNVAMMGLEATLLLGLSVPRHLLPSGEQIRRDVVEHEEDGIFVDHQRDVRVQKYFEETDFAGVEDDLLGKCLAKFDFRPDFLLLDSAGHMGHVELRYVVPLIKGRCFFALDDTNHVKHYQSVREIKQDPRFRVLVESQEKFGFCFAEFNP